MSTSSTQLSRRSHRGRLIGNVGYSLPNFDACQTYSLVPTTSIPNVIIDGPIADNGNRLIVHKDVSLRQLLHLHVSAETYDALVVIGDDCTLGGHISLHSCSQTVVLSGGVPSVGHSGYFSAQMYNPRQLLFIGRGATTNGSAYILGGDGLSIIVADDCMFANNVILQTTDSHAVMDMADGRWRNPPADILLEPHVWLAQSVIVGKGVTIGMGAIVGAHSLVLKNVDRFTSVGGVPARVLARDVTWDRQGIPTPGSIDALKRLAEVVPSPGTSTGL